MRLCVTVEIIRGPAAGRDALVEPGFSVVVGRLPECNLAVLDDPTVSRRHFQVEWRGQDVFVANLSSNGITVNCRAVEQAKLADGDIVEFGMKSALKVHIENEENRERRSRERAASTLEVSAVPDLAPILCRRQTAPTGIQVHTSVDEDPSAVELLQFLQQWWRLDLVIKLKAPEADLKTELAKSPALMDWLPPESRMQFSPLIVAQPQPFLLAQLLQQSQPGAIAVFSTSEPERVLQQLRKFAGAFASPDVLRPQLTDTTPELAAALLAELQSLVIVSNAGGWTLFSTAETGESLVKFGFQVCDDAQS